MRTLVRRRKSEQDVLKSAGHRAKRGFILGDSLGWALGAQAEPAGGYCAPNREGLGERLSFPLPH